MTPAPVRLRDFVYSKHLSDLERRALLRTAHMADELGANVCVVGGAVRDWMLGQDVDDIDIVVEGDAVAFAKAVETRHGGHVHVYERFRTTTWHIDGLNIDITTARTETYPLPASLPRVEPASLEDDFRRRDFTVNAMALRLGGRWLEPDADALLDPHGGLKDLQNGLLRAFHERSFVDDPTRILRAARYLGRFDFMLDLQTRSWLDHGLPYLARLSGERVKYDFELHFVEPRPERALIILRDWGVFGALGVTAPDERRLVERFVRARSRLGSGDWPRESLGLPSDAIAHAIGWAVLIYNMGQLTASRWIGATPFEHHTREALLELGPLSTLSASVFSGQLKASEQHALLEPFSGLGLFLAWLLDNDPMKRHALLSEWRDWRWVRPATTGDDLRARGIPPGPVYHRILERLRNARLDGVVASLDEEQALLEQLIDKLV